MTERERLIEAMARALAVGRGRVAAGPGEVKDAARVLSAIEAMGAVVVMSGQCSHSGVCKAAQEEPS